MSKSLSKNTADLTPAELHNEVAALRFEKGYPNIDTFPVGGETLHKWRRGEEWGTWCRWSEPECFTFVDDGGTVRVEPNHSGMGAPEGTGATLDDGSLGLERNELLDVLGKRKDDITSARGDLHHFRAQFYAITRSSKTHQLPDLGPKLKQLLTPHFKETVVSGGGRFGTGTSTVFESLDGRFSIRITHSQVGATPVGNPPQPRIHLNMGPPTGHGSHVVLPPGTTLSDILRALR